MFGSALLYLPVLVCVVGMTAGQLLFKRVAIEWQAARPTLLQLAFNPTLLTALFIYGLTTLLWIYSLRQLDLSRAYPVMAINFVLVPLVAQYLFGEALTPTYWLGIALIMAGIVICVK